MASDSVLIFGTDSLFETTPPAWQEKSESNGNEINSLEVDPKKVVERLLRACQRCKRLRKKCDTHLPDCRLCQKAGIECIIPDGSRGHPLPRRYVQFLLTRLNRLRAIQSAGKADTQPTRVQKTPFLTPPQSVATMSAGNCSQQYLTSEHFRSFDFLFDTTSGTIHSSRFFGASSGLSLTVETLSVAYLKGILSPEDKPQFSRPPMKSRMSFNQSHSVDQNEVQSLVETFVSNIYEVYPILDTSTIREDLLIYLNMKNLTGDALKHLESQQHNNSHSMFRINMICAITCAVRSQREAMYTAESSIFFAKACPLIDQVTSESTPAALYAVLLLSLYCILVPERGDTWRLLSYASRLSLELGYHLTPAGQDGDKNTLEKEVRHRTLQALYVMENFLAQYRGRQSDLDQNVGDEETENFPVYKNQTVQRPQIMQFRTRIYREMYVVSSTSDFQMDWYREKYIQLLAWRPPNSYDMTSNINIAASIAYNCTVCFLFQPMLLQALSKIQDRIGQDNLFSKDNEQFFSNGFLGSIDPECGGTTSLPSECYEAACALIEIYDNVLLGPLDSQRSLYPLSVLSVQALYLAGMVVMAICLVIDDDKPAFMEPIVPLVPQQSLNLSGHGVSNRGDVQALINPSYSTFKQANYLPGLCKYAATCLVLLSRCAERFPSSVGMLHTYRKLYDHVVPNMVRKGHT